MKLRKVCITMNNYSLDDFEKMKAHIETFCTFGVLGKEVGDSGTRHIQGYVEYKNGRTFKRLKEIYEGCHLEKKRGTNTQAADYCKKDGDYWEHGTTEPESQGRRGDLQAISEHIRDDNGIRDMIESNLITNAQHMCVAEKCMKYFEPQRDRKPTVWWLWGPTGLGKTKDVMETVKKPWISNGSLQWFDGYDAQEDVVFDDFRESDVDFHLLLRLLDRYPVSVPIKGSFRAFRPLRIFITTPYPISETYKWIGEDIEQLRRRVDYEYEYKKGADNNFSLGME